MMHRLFLLATFVFLTLTPRPTTESNVLGLFPHFGYSHFKVFYPVLRSLAERGHNVTVITYNKNPQPHPNYEEMLLTGEETMEIFTMDIFPASRSLLTVLSEYFALHSEGQQSCENFYQSGYVEKILERHANQPYDLVIMEFFNTDCYLGVPYLLQVPVVGLSSCALMPWYYDRILLPDMPSFVQSEFIGFPEELNWHQRLINFVQSRANKLLYRYHTNYKDSKIIKKYLNIDVDVDEIAKSSTSMIFVNQHYSLSGIRPATAQYLEIGGIHINESDVNEPLPSYLEDFLRKSTKGVLFISWGSMLRSSTIDETKLDAILKALKQLPLRVVWKWESTEKPTEDEHFLFIRWAPQLTLLCHPKVKLFWGHGGLLGTTEAAYCAKPLIVTPNYGDQFTNGHAVENRRIGKIMHYNEIDLIRLESLFQEVMRPRYTENAQTISKIFRNRETTPLQTTMWWIEHLLQHGKTASDLLRTKAVNLNWFVYYSLDSVALLFLIGLIFILVFRYAIKLVCMARSCRQAVDKEKKL